MKKNSAKDNILFWLQNNPGNHHGAAMQRMDFKNRNGSNASGDTIKRRCNDLVKEGKAFVDYKHGEAYFSAEYRPKLKQIVTFEEKEGVRVAIIKQVPISV